MTSTLPPLRKTKPFFENHRSFDLREVSKLGNGSDFFERVLVMALVEQPSD